MDYFWLIILGIGIVVMLYASSRARAQRRAGWEDVFTPAHGNVEAANEFRAALNERGIESRMNYPGVAGSPVTGMSGMSEVWVSVHRGDATAARKVLREVLEQRAERRNTQGEN